MFFLGIAEIPSDCRWCEFQRRGGTVVRVIELVRMFVILSPSVLSADKVAPKAAEAIS
jgi:hypothetical protein